MLIVVIQCFDCRKYYYCICNYYMHVDKLMHLCIEIDIGIVLVPSANDIITVGSSFFVSPFSEFTLWSWRHN